MSSPGKLPTAPTNGSIWSSVPQFEGELATALVRIDSSCLTENVETSGFVRDRRLVPFDLVGEYTPSSLGASAVIDPPRE